MPNLVHHPLYLNQFSNWSKYRKTYEGGDVFIEAYLQKFSVDEDVGDFNKRRSISYCPAHAKQAINKVKNAIFQRFVDISRSGGSKNYQEAVSKNIDLLGNSLNTFLGMYTLPELLSIGLTYIYVDSPILNGTSQVATINKHPYIYAYPAENVLSWTQGTSRDPKEFTSVILVDRAFELDEELKVPKGYVDRYRRMWLEDGKVMVQFYKPKEASDNETTIVVNKQAVDLERDGEPIVLNIPEIPLISLKLTDSLLSDVSDYQIALLNLASSDMSYLIKSNTVIYTEQFDAKIDALYKRLAAPNGEGTSNEAQEARDKQIQIGHGKGRGYPVGTDRPGFISPSSDPVKVSMEKQRMLQEEIERLIDIKLETLSLTGEAKKFDKQGLEAGLSYIGLVLEQADRKIAKFFAMYENSEVATVNYPTDYSLKTDAGRKQEAEETSKLKNKVPSKTYQKEISKQVARILLAPKVPFQTMQKIENEIDKADYLTSDIEELSKAVETGLVTTNTASIAAGFAEGEAQKAKVEHAERLARIAAAQSSASPRGVDSMNMNQEVDDKKQIKDLEDTTEDNKRGEGK